MSKEVTITKGDRYGRLKILSELEPYVTSSTGQKYRQFRCRCECGKIVECLLKSLRSGHTKSCGCLNVDIIYTKDGASLHPLYAIWLDMNRRCHNPLHARYSSYGGRGIKVYSKWSEYDSNGFWNFISWEENLPKNKQRFLGSMLDRKNNDGNYVPNNCRFVSPTISNRNRRNVIMVDEGKYKNKSLIEAWEESKTNTKYNTCYQRYTKGWSIEEALR